MSMQLQSSTLEYEERVTEASVLPTRHTVLVLELIHGYPWVGRPDDAPLESLAVAVEVKHHGGEYEEVARLGPYEDPGVYRLDMPVAPEEEDAPQFISSGQRRTSFRCRLLKHGRHESRHRLKVEGL